MMQGAVVMCKAVRCDRDATRRRSRDCDNTKALQRRCSRCDARMRWYLRAVCLVRAIFDGVGDGLMRMCCGSLWLRLMGGEAVWWMRDGERRADEVFNNWGAGCSLENQTESALRISRNIKGDFASSTQRRTSNSQVRAARHWLASAQAETGRGTVVDLESAAVHACDPGWQLCDPTRQRTRPLASNTPAAPSTQLHHSNQQVFSLNSTPDHLHHSSYQQTPHTLFNMTGREYSSQPGASISTRLATSPSSSTAY